MANKKLYRVKVLVGDGAPGLIPWTYHLHSENRDKAVSEVRRRIRQRGKVVKHILFATSKMPEVMRHAIGGYGKGGP